MGSSRIPVTCRAMRSWTFTGLVGAFLDLAIACLLLSASALVFFASKFLGFFGLELPCPCSGLFGTPNHNMCLERLLVDLPTERVSSVQLSVKGKFPFDSVWAKDRDCQLNLRLTRGENDRADGFIEMEGEASCNSISGAAMLEQVDHKEFDVVNSPPLFLKEGKFDLKGKGVVNPRPRSGLRRRRKVFNDHGKVSSVSASSPSYLRPPSPSSINYKGNMEPADRAVHLNYDDASSSVFGERASSGFQFNESLYEIKPIENKELSFEPRELNIERQRHHNGNEKDVIRILELELEEERSARAALYLELEKERNAASTAADEAMAMILRLQEEKASIGMEARQYQRMIEEKSAYDAEEMNILKEIIMRREREKHFLEKEVEAYRLMYGANQQSQVLPNQDMGEEIESSLYMKDDPILMLQQLSESIDRKEMISLKLALSGDPSLETEFSIRRELFPELGQEDFSTKRQEETTEKDHEMHPYVYDVHVIEGSQENSNGVLEDDEDKENHFPLDASEALVKDVVTDCSSSRGIDANELDRTRSSSETIPGLPPRSNMRRNSMSAIDNERTKIETEVGWLRERLRVVQEGRDKLSLSTEHLEREELQLQLLEDISSQLRQLTEPEKAARRASLPLPSSKSVKEKAPTKCICRTSSGKLMSCLCSSTLEQQYKNLSKNASCGGDDG